MRSSENGKGKIGLLIMILIFAAIVYVLVKVVPKRVNAYEYNDFIQQYTRDNIWGKKPEQVRHDLLQKARDLNLPVTAKQIKITRRGANAEVEVKFDLPINLKVYTWVLHYDFKNSAEDY